MKMPTQQVAPETAGQFSRMLKHWRGVRRLSQLELAGEADISPRHLCFLETGRAQPSREMVQTLGIALDLPFDEQNALHIAAGFVPPFGDRDLEADDLQHVRQAFDFILKQQEPYPAIVIDGRWDVRIRNDASRRIMGIFRQGYDMPAKYADNAMHVVFHPKGLRQFIVNWNEFASHLIQILHREVAQNGRVAVELLSEIVAYPDLPEDWKRPNRVSAPVMPMHLRKGDLDLSFFTTFTSLAMPTDAALQKMKIECFYPADSATEAKARKLVFD